MTLCGFGGLVKGRLGARRCVGRTDGGRNAKRNDDGAKANLITIVEPAWAGYAFFADVCAVLASEILDEHAPFARTDHAMSTAQSVMGMPLQYPTYPRCGFYQLLSQASTATK